MQDSDRDVLFAAGTRDGDFLLGMDEATEKDDVAAVRNNKHIGGTQVNAFAKFGVRYDVTGTAHVHPQVVPRRLMVQSCNFVM